MKSRVWRIIPSEFRGRAIWVAITIFARALLNFVGIAMLVPVLILILDSDSIANNEQLNAIYVNYGFTSYISFILAICGIAISVIILKNVAILWMYRYERDFIYSLYKHISIRLYTSYFRRGLGFIKHNNSAILTRNVNVVSLMFVTGILKPVASIVGEILLLALIFTALALYSPIAALVAITVFLPAVLLFYLLVRRRLNNIGQHENESQRAKSRIVAETFRGYADIEINNAFPNMFKRFSSATDEVVRLRKENATIGMLPQMIIEIGLIMGMVAIVLICASGDNSSMRIMFGVFAVAALRLIPVIRAIMSSWSAIRYNRYTIDVLADAEIDYDIAVCNEDNDRFHFSKCIELHDIGFIFDDASKPTLESLSLTINKGEKIGIRGTSGVGKTTLFNLILGLYKPTSGYIAIDDEKLSDNNIRKWQNSIGYVSQNVFIADMTLAENIALGYSPETIDYNRINKVVEMSDLKEFVATLDNGVNSRIGEQGCRLSGGQRQRIGIARALYKNSDVLFFDEATSSLDGQTEENINNSIRKLSDENRQLTIVVIAHRESSLEYCDRVITLE